MTVELPVNGLAPCSSLKEWSFMVPGPGIHQNGHLVFEAHINQLCGRDLRVQDGQGSLQCEANIKRNAKTLEKQSD